MWRWDEDHLNVGKPEQCVFLLPFAVLVDSTEKFLSCGANASSLKSPGSRVYGACSDPPPWESASGASPDFSTCNGQAQIWSQLHFSSVMIPIRFVQDVGLDGRFIPASQR